MTSSDECPSTALGEPAAGRRVHEAGTPSTFVPAPSSPGSRLADPGRTVSRSASHRSHASNDASSVGILTLVMWVGCLGIGTLGGLLPYPRPAATPVERPPVVAQFIHVELAENRDDTKAESSVVEPPPQPPASEPAPPQPTVSPPPAPPPAVPVAVAAPTQEIETLAPAVTPNLEPSATDSVATPPPPSRGSIPPTASGDTASTAIAPVQTLAFGQGEGRQPAPAYPRRAIREGQQGSVVVRLTVGEDGRVVTAEAAVPCPWPLLNESAVRVVRERWRFRPGPVRHYEVSIRFQLNRP